MRLLLIDLHEPLQRRGPLLLVESQVAGRQTRRALAEVRAQNLLVLGTLWALSLRIALWAMVDAAHGGEVDLSQRLES